MMNLKHTLIKHPRGGHYYTRIQIGGVMKYFSFGTGRRAAEQELKDLEQRIDRGEVAFSEQQTSQVVLGNGKRDIRIEELAHRHLEWVLQNRSSSTFSLRRHYVLQFLKFTGEAMISGITRMRLEEFYAGVRQGSTGPLVNLICPADGMLAVFHNDRQGGRLLARHLLTNGHRWIAGIRLTESNPVLTEGFRETCAAAGMQPVEFKTVGDFMAVAQDYTGVACGSGSILMRLYIRAAGAGLRIPADLSVVAAADLDVAGKLTPPVVALDRTAHTLGKAAAEIMLAALQGEEVENQRMEWELTPGESVAAPAKTITKPAPAPQPKPAPATTPPASAPRPAPTQAPRPAPAPIPAQPMPKPPQPIPASPAPVPPAPAHVGPPVAAPPQPPEPAVPQPVPPPTVAEPEPTPAPEQTPADAEPIEPVAVIPDPSPVEPVPPPTSEESLTAAEGATEETPATALETESSSDAQDSTPPVAEETTGQVLENDDK